MKAIICTKYGSPDVLQLREVEKPTPKSNEVLIRVHAASVSAGDCELRGMRLPLSWQFIARIGFGFRGPRRKILGQEFAGEIESIGTEVKQFKKGDQVFGTTGFSLGAYAEYVCLPARSETQVMVTKPPSMTFEEATAVPVGGLEALHFLKRGNIQREQKILVNGAGGSIGTFAVQLARYFGAKVTGVDSAEKLDVLHSIGVDQVIDYTKEDFTKNGQSYDAILDVTGKISFSGCLGSLNPGGLLLLANPTVPQMIRGSWTSRTGKKKVIFGAAKQKAEDLNYLKELIEAGKIKPIIDRHYPLEQIPEAHRYVESGRKKGNVVITIFSG
jgi:2-desacetyl-2-hydroxyethyl bacteriochlorophyllide A dehydrogenase